MAPLSEAERIRARVNACLKLIRVPEPSDFWQPPGHGAGVTDNAPDHGEPGVGTEAALTIVEDGAPKLVSDLLDDADRRLTKALAHDAREEQDQRATHVLQGRDLPGLIGLVRHARTASLLMEAELTRWRSGDNGAAQKAEAA